MTLSGGAVARQTSFVHDHHIMHQHTLTRNVVGSVFDLLRLMIRAYESRKYITHTPSIACPTTKYYDLSIIPIVNWGISEP